MDLIAAFGTGDLDPALAPGDAADGLAVLADKVLVLLVLTALPDTPDPPLQAAPEGVPVVVLLLPLVDVFGEHPEDGDAPHRQTEIVQDADPQQAGEQAADQAQPDEGHVQMIHAVAAVHETGKTVADLAQEIHREDPFNETAFTLHVFYSKKVSQ